MRASIALSRIRSLFIFESNSKRAILKSRIRIIFALIFLFTLLIISRLYFLQVVHGDEYSAMADGQYIKQSTGFYNRGDIFFTNKSGEEISVATVKDGYILAINPSMVENAGELYKKINTVIDLDEEEFSKTVVKVNDPYEELRKYLTEQDAEKLRALNEESIILVRHKWRYYPGDVLAAHALGFVAYDGNEQVGLYGLESYFEDVLKREGSSLYVNFFAELFSSARDIIFLPSEKREGDIVSTIEPSVQLHLEQTLKNMAKEWESEMVAGIIIEPKTGKIRAMAVSPDFNLNKFSKADPNLYPNILVERVYEMGSIIKPLTVAAAIDAGAITTDTTYNDTGSVQVEGHRIYNHDRVGRGVVSMQEVLSQSLNTGAVYAQRAIGKDAFRKYMYKLALDEETGVDLPHESMNLVNNLESSREIEYATASFGQGIALTPMSTTRALGALSTGYLAQPHLIEKIRSTAGLTDVKDYTDMQVPVFDSDTVEDISRLLVEAVDETLLGGTMKMEHYTVAAKTGTAQIPKDEGGYYEDDVLHTFFGYFPAYDPKFLIFTMNMRPQGAPYASQTLARPFFDIAKFLINYYDIPPDR